MNFMYFVEGAVIGFSLAAPIGPVGILCVRRTLEHGARYGLVIGVSAASCDMVNSIVAAFGITLVSDFITLEQYWIRLVGGIILLVIGFGAFRTHPLADKAVKAPRGHMWAFFSTALLVLTKLCMRSCSRTLTRGSCFWSWEKQRSSRAKAALETGRWRWRHRRGRREIKESLSRTALLH